MCYISRCPISPRNYIVYISDYGFVILWASFDVHFLLKGVNFINEKDIQINDKIKDLEVRVIDQDGNQLGVMSSQEALNKAFEAELDLIKISPNANPPVCKIYDFGKYRYEAMKKDKESKKNQKQAELKEIRMTPNIDTNDLNTKINAAKKFLEKGHKLKVTLRFRGRELSRMKDSEHLLTEFASALTDFSSIEKEPKIEGRMMSLVLTPKK